MKRSSVLLVALLTTGLAAGCGGDDGEDGGDGAEGEPAQVQTQESAPSPAPAEGGDGPEAAFQRFQSALADGDADAACGLLTDSAIEQVEEASIGGSCEDWVDELTGVYDERIKAELRRTQIDDVTIDGDAATLEYTSPVLAIPVEAELEQVDGEWRLSRLAEGV